MFQPSNQISPLMLASPTLRVRIQINMHQCNIPPHKWDITATRAVYLNSIFLWTPFNWSPTAATSVLQASIGWFPIYIETPFLLLYTLQLDPTTSPSVLWLSRHQLFSFRSPDYRKHQCMSLLPRCDVTMVLLFCIGLAFKWQNVTWVNTITHQILPASVEKHLSGKSVLILGPLSLHHVFFNFSACDSSNPPHCF